MAKAPNRKIPPHKQGYDRAEVMERVCAELEKGKSLSEACRDLDNCPTPAAILTWVREDPDGIGKGYVRARELGYKLLADEIIAISEQTHTWTHVHEVDPDGNPLYDEAGNPRLKKVLIPLSPDVIAHNRLRIDTLKWTLSKMLPKVYGDKLDLTSGGEKIGITISSDDANL